MVCVVTKVAGKNEDGWLAERDTNGVSFKLEVTEYFLMPNLWPVTFSFQILIHKLYQC
jgi:hypothetical protein